MPVLRVVQIILSLPSAVTFFKIDCASYNLASDVSAFTFMPVAL